MAGGKILAYSYYQEAFSAARQKAFEDGRQGIKDKDDFLHYLNWKTPRLSLLSDEFSTGVYAGNTSWHKGVRFFYSELVYDDAPRDYTEYIKSIGEDKFMEIVDDKGLETGNVCFEAVQNGQTSEGKENGEYSIVGSIKYEDGTAKGEEQ